MYLAGGSVSPTLRFQVFNCTRETFVQNVCVFFHHKKQFYRLQPMKLPHRILTRQITTVSQFACIVC